MRLRPIYVAPLVTTLLFVSITAVAAFTWQGTDWISDNAVIASEKLIEDFEYLNETLGDVSVTSGENFGLGTLDASSKLEVNGSIAADEFCDSSGQVCFRMSELINLMNK